MNSMNNCSKCFVLGEADWKVNNDTVLKPDVVLICNETNKAPEVISKSTAKRDEVHKFKIYEEEKVKYYVIVYRLESNNYTKEGDFSLETYDFEETSCKSSVNFANVFKRFRK